MLDIKAIRENADSIKSRLATRGGDAHLLIDEVLACDETRRKAETDKQSLQSQRKQRSKQIGALMGQGKADEAEAIKEEVRNIGEQIAELDKTSEKAGSRQSELLMSIPNLPHAECPIGADETANPELRTWGEKPDIAEPLDHVALAEKHGLISFDDGTRITGSGFVVYRGKGARLERALIQFLLNTQSEEHGYEEVNVPHIIKRECMEGTGQLPKFEDDMYGIEENSLFLAPTAEVPVTNLYRETLLKEEELPVKLTAYTPCFRREAGSAGRENRGIIRMHQFDKVELVQIIHPEQSADGLEALTGHAEAILQKLGLHYRVIELCTGDIGFSSTKTYDIEVWSPGQNKFLEVSSCSNFGDYQARRMRLRFKDADGKNQICHTLNGSGTALPRLFVALIEQYQQPDGSILIPEALVPYFGAESIA
ncbi:serine--tRNA ligase [Verrucomicrobiaceae bacterium N1E253]|uniref:Serine--tRNA ligase n=1 Tax=Oceaniferula marina TaxID=2748318 RepID=A0A851GFA6_9BACT|nr:serine--tRNA ligase [Oceaniferula marina]NWK56213.1 serine--tRNA ligase [Oceaniferula marina]